MATVVMLDVPSTVFVADMVIVQTWAVLSSNYAVAIYYLAPVTVTDLVCLVNMNYPPPCSSDAILHSRPQKNTSVVSRIT